MIGTALGPYQIESKLGQGGMGEVYRATDSKLRREVAIKVLPPAFSEDAERLARFEREAQMLAQLHHSNIASIFGLEESGETQALVMELVEGPTLDERMAQGAFPLEDALQIARQLAEALEAAHEKGIVHRDLKPQNIKITADGTVKVLDFGLAKAMDPTEGAASGAGEHSPTLLDSPTLTALPGTQLGVILGTAAYMSPEQARGSAVDKRADIWAFGAVLWEMLAGRALFEGATVSDIIAGVLKTEIDFKALPTSTPAAVRRLLRRCLERNPKNRLHDIADARIVIDDLLGGKLEEPSAIGGPASSVAAWRTRFGWLAAGAVLAAGVLIGWPTRREAPTGVDTPPKFSLRRLTELPGAELHPSLSPDGRMIAFSSSAAGNLDLYLLRVGGDRSIPLTDDPADDSQPAFSRNGEQIAFRSEREGGGLFVMGATGESVRRVTDAGFDPSWSPDGRHLVYGTEAVVDPVSRDGNSELWIVEVDSGERTLLWSGDGVQPVWSPRGDRIAFWANDGGQRDLWTISAAGGEPIAVTQDEATDWSPEWSPDGRWLVFSSDRGGSHNLWKVLVDPETGDATGEPQPMTTGVRGMGYARFSSDGTRLAVMAYERTFEQTLYAVDPQDLTRLETLRTLRNPSARWCNLSPNGAKMACNTANAPEDLLVLKTDGSEMRRLTSDLHKDRAPIWDPAGERLAFYSTRSGSWEGWTVRSDGSDLRQVTDLGETFLNGWSPDGNRLLGSRGDEPNEEFVWVDPEKINTPEMAVAIPELSAEQGFAANSWSHQGDRIAGGIDTSFGRCEAIAIFTFSTGSFRRLDVPVAGRSFGAVGGWTNDDRHLIVRSAEGLVAVDVENGGWRKLGPAGPRSTVSLSRDGRTLSVEEEILDSDIWLLEFESEDGSP